MYIVFSNLLMFHEQIGMGLWKPIPDLQISRFGRIQTTYVPPFEFPVSV